MKIVIRRGTSKITAGFAIKMSVFVDNEFKGYVKESDSLSFEVASIHTMTIKIPFQKELLIPIQNLSDEIEIREFTLMGLWLNKLYAYVISGDSYIGEYGY